MIVVSRRYIRIGDWKVNQEIDNMVKICYIVPSIDIPDTSGGFVHVYNVSINLIKKGVEVHAVCRRAQKQKSFDVLDGLFLHRVYRGLVKQIKGNPADTHSKFKEKLVNVLGGIYFNSIYKAYITQIVIKIIRKYNIDILIERGDSRGIGGLSALITQKPLFVEVRDNYQDYLSLRIAKRILTYNEKMIKRKIDAKKISLMTGGVDVNKFRPVLENLNVKEKIGFASQDVVGCTVNIYRTQDIETILKAGKKVIKTFPNTRFFIIGPYQQEKLGELNNLREHFVFTGVINHDQIPSYIAACDVMLALYSPEKKNSILGPPYKVLEYMACGKPVIVTEFEESRKIIKDGVNGFLVKENDAEDVANKIELLLQNKNLRKKMGVDARKTSERYSWEKVTQKLLNDIYNVI